MSGKTFWYSSLNGIIFLQPDIPLFLLLLRRVFKNLNGSVSQKYSHHYHSESNQPSFYLIANTIWNSNEVELICRPTATKWNIPHLRRLPWNLFIPSKENYFSLRHSNNGIYGSWLRPILDYPAYQCTVSTWRLKNLYWPSHFLFQNQPTKLTN